MQESITSPATPEPPILFWEAAPWREERAHGATEPLRAARAQRGGSGFSFVDQVAIPPGSYVGLHRHDARSEELYVIVAGAGVAVVDGFEHQVGPGDVVWNRPGGTHGLRNPYDVELRMVVVETEV